MTRVGAGESEMPEVRIGRWLVADGAWVEAGQCVCELETEKATQELETDEAGVLRHLKRERERLAEGEAPFRIE